MKPNNRILGCLSWVLLFIMQGCYSQKTVSSNPGFHELVKNKLGDNHSAEYNESETMAICWKNLDDYDEKHDYIIVDLENQKIAYENFGFRGKITWETDSVIKVRRITGIPTEPEVQGGITYYDLINQVNIEKNNVKK